MSDRFRVYIAGPYRSMRPAVLESEVIRSDLSLMPVRSVMDYEGVDANIAQARRAAGWLAREGISFFCPHTHGAHFDVITPEVTEDFWLKLDLEHLEDCTHILLVGDWHKSSGTKAELARMNERQCPSYEFAVIGSRAKLVNAYLEWQAEHALDRAGYL